jgi:hypothetical protein
MEMAGRETAEKTSLGTLLKRYRVVAGPTLSHLPRAAAQSRGPKLYGPSQL